MGLKQAIKSGKNDYLSPSNDASQHRRQHSVRLHHYSSIDSYYKQVISLNDSNEKFTNLKYINLDNIDADQTIEEKIQDLKNTKSLLESQFNQVQSRISAQNLNMKSTREQKLAHLSQIQKSIEIISKTQDLKLSKICSNLSLESEAEKLSKDKQKLAILQNELSLYSSIDSETALLKVIF